jgi:hypothetical protein
MTMTVPQTPFQQRLLTDDAVEQTLTLVATMVGLPRETVAKIVEAGLPMMAHVADENPYVFRAMFAQSRMSVPEPSPKVYAQLKKDPHGQQALANAFRTIFGATTDALNREAARRASATEGQAAQVLATTMPAVVKAMGTQNTQNNEMGFGLQLRKVIA